MTVCVVDTHISFLVDKSMWQEVIELYPALLDCVTCNSPDVRFALKEALTEFSELLAVPGRLETSAVQNGPSIGDSNDVKN